MMNEKWTLLAVAVVASLLSTVALEATAATVSAPVSTIGGVGTPVDWAIDAAIASRQLSQTDRVILREQLQMQFLSLTPAARQQVLSVLQNNRKEDAVSDVIAALGAAVAQTGRQVEAAFAETAASARRDPQAMQQKIGGDGDLVYLATLGPCRIYDSRLGPGQLAPGAARQIYTISIFNGYSFGVDQGGTGVTGSGNCVPTAFSGVRPTAVVATVTVVNTTASGALQAWNGGTTLSGGAVVNWNAGDRLSNTTVIPMDRTIAAYPGSGAKRDIAVNNNSGAAIDFVIDVVGYMIENQVAALDCQLVTSATVSVPNNSWTNIDATCPAGYTATGGGFGTTEGTLGYPQVWTFNLPVSDTTWRTWVDNQTGGNRSIYTRAQCCRIPGR